MCQGQVHSMKHYQQDSCWQPPEEGCCSWLSIRNIVAVAVQRMLVRTFQECSSC
jgi:hypothetical protein